MIIDSHCHAWDYWPYQDKNNHEPNQIPVPNPHNWGNIDQLVYEMKKIMLIMQLSCQHKFGKILKIIFTLKVL